MVVMDGSVLINVIEVNRQDLSETTPDPMDLAGNPDSLHRFRPPEMRSGFPGVFSFTERFVQDCCIR